VTVVTHSSTRAGLSHQTAESRDASTRDDVEQTDRGPEQRPVARSTVGWRYGSALAAARALNARPARA
jgi:hypothetical protein